MSTARSVVCLGETMALVAPDPPVPLADASGLVLGCAGAESNVAIGLARLGTPVQWCSRVGTDPLGTRIVAELTAAGVGTELVRFSPTARTGLMLKDPAADGTTVLYYRDASAASAMDETDADRALGCGASVLHLSGITPGLSRSCARAVDHALDRAADAGLQLSFDVNFRPAIWADAGSAAAHLAGIARRCDIVFVGLDEASALWQTSTSADVRSRFAEVGVLIVKDGERAAVSFDTDGRVEVAALPVEVAEPIGAGDAFAAGWLHAHLRGLSAAAKLRLGHLMAAGSLTSPTDHPMTPVPAAELLAMATDQATWPPPEWPGPDPDAEDA